MTTRRVPFFPYAQLFLAEEKALTNVMQDVLRRGAYILQKDCREFEQNLAKFLGVKHALGVANCTDGLHIALRAADIGSGDEVILPSHTFVATASAVHYAGATPVLADCGPDHLMDPASVAKLVTPKTKAIMPVQLNGRTCRMDDLQAIADKHKLTIIEDAAQSLGAKYKGKMAGSFGLAAAYSFYPAKNLGCFGDGGAVVTNDDDIAHKLYCMRDHGRNHDGVVEMWGINTRLDNLQAAVLNYRLAGYENIIAHRRNIATWYHERLHGLSKLTLPPSPEKDVYFDVYQNYEIEAENRDQLKVYLKEHGVDTLVQWGGKAIHQLDALGLSSNLPQTEKLFTRCLMLPLNMAVTEDDVEYISGLIRKFYP
ncbi:MAG: DegT/DnrJ/EryC1/StrS family aminotransferase [Deltaproteobacteria bacterium]|nr:DegT/DnrJ/EryC1/StrS family aminotransferase [Deltaproteobacteria bacterium]